MPIQSPRILKEYQKEIFLLFRLQLANFVTTETRPACDVLKKKKNTRQNVCKLRRKREAPGWFRWMFLWLSRNRLADDGLEAAVSRKPHAKAVIAGGENVATRKSTVQGTHRVHRP